MRKWIAAMLALSLACASFASAQQQMEQPKAGIEQKMPPEKPEGTPPDSGMPVDGAPMDGQKPPEMPDGQMNMPMPSGGMQGAPDSYDAVYTVRQDTLFSEPLLSEGKDENVIHVEAGAASVSGAKIERVSNESSGGDAASFYGVGAAILATGGTVEIGNSEITTDASGGTGVFAYGDGVAKVQNTTIRTKRDASGGIHVAGGGTLYAKDLTVTTEGESAAAIRSDRGSGTMVVDGGSYTSSGVGSPAVYVTADISIHDANLKAIGSEALCMEGLNTVRLYDCDLSGDMQDLRQNDHTWTVIVYQSMSGDSQVGEGRFEMVGGTLNSENGGLFYTTNTESEFVLRDVDINAAEDCEYFLRVSGNANERGWGETGKNGADCRFTAIEQKMEGNVIWDSVSNLDMYVLENSQLIGAVVQDESYAGTGGDGTSCLSIDESSTWLVTGDSRLTELRCAGSIVDVYGNAVSVVSTTGEVLLSGKSGYTVTVESFTDICDSTGAGTISAWEEHEVEF